MMLKDLQERWRAEYGTNSSYGQAMLSAANSLSPFVEREQEDMELLREFCHELVKVYGKGGAEMSGVYLKARERLKEFGL